jgi:hypothetical protein
MFTKERLLQVITEVPSEFSLEELATILNQPQPTTAGASGVSLAADLLASANEWAHYMSPVAKALYTNYSASPTLLALQGIASQLPADDLRKNAHEWEAERIQAKYGL